MRLLSSSIIIYSLLLFAYNATAQTCAPIVRTYVWFQPVTPGNAAKGKPNETKRKGNYFIYVESPQVFDLKALWIYGDKYPAKLKSVKSPVVMNKFPGEQRGAENEKIVLVPATKKKVFQVIITTDISSLKTAQVPAKYRSKPVLIKLSYGKKICYCISEQIKELNPLGMF